MNQVYHVKHHEGLLTEVKPINNWKTKTHLHVTKIKEDDEIYLLEVKNHNQLI